MAYDRYDTRDAPREERSRWRDDRDDGRGDRGFFERAGDKVASWFGDEEAERRRREDRGREGGWSGARYAVMAHPEAIATEIGTRPRNE